MSHCRVYVWLRLCWWEWWWCCCLFVWKFYLWCSFQTRCKHFKCNGMEQSSTELKRMERKMCIATHMRVFMTSQRSLLLRSFYHNDEIIYTHPNIPRIIHKAKQQTQRIVFDLTKHIRQITLIRSICAQTISQTSGFPLHYFMACTLTTKLICSLFFKCRP